jgi:hypothetical protein
MFALFLKFLKLKTISKTLRDAAHASCSELIRLLQPARIRKSAYSNRTVYMYIGTALWG